MLDDEKGCGKNKIREGIGVLEEGGFAILNTVANTPWKVTFE